MINVFSIVMFALELLNVQLALQDIIYKIIVVLVVVKVNTMTLEVVPVKTAQLDVKYAHQLQIAQLAKQHFG